MKRHLENDAGESIISDGPDECSDEQIELMDLIKPLLDGHRLDVVVSTLMTLTVSGIVSHTDKEDTVLHLDQLAQSIYAVKNSLTQ
jgi:hypothetical protein